MTGSLALLQRKGEKKENVSVELGQCSSGSVKNSNLPLFVASRGEVEGHLPNTLKPFKLFGINIQKQVSTSHRGACNIAQTNKGPC